MQSPAPNSPGRVLIIDPSDDSREVLRTVLSRRGVQIFEAPVSEAALAIARDEHPDVIVLDIDESSPDFAACGEISEQVKSDRASLVIIGNLPRESAAAPREIVAKPYHYGPLIRKIEELLAESAARFPQPAREAA